MFRLHNGVDRSAWGSLDAIPRFLGEVPDGEPVSEVWIGTHPGLPSQAVDADGRERPLVDVAGELPFLVKLLAAGRPVSLQVHPSLEQARRGHAAEEAAGVPVDAPQRTFKDPNHKPEMAYALTPFETLVGFRPEAEIVGVLGPVAAPLSAGLLTHVREDGIAGAVAWLLTSGVSESDVDSVVVACRDLLERGDDEHRAYATVVELAEHHPGDVGVVLSLLLNRVTLQPGEAAYLGAGVVHAHLRGLCVEVMAASDNVLRAGLTPKHVDVAGLLECLDATPLPDARVVPRHPDPTTTVFAPAGADFELTVLRPANDEPVGLHPPTPAILLCVEGEVSVTTAVSEAVPVRRGESLLVTGDDGRLSVSGTGAVVLAAVPG